MPKLTLAYYVDRGHALNEQIKKAKKELDAIKDKLKEHAVKHDKGVIKGTNTEVHINPNNQSAFVDVPGFYMHLIQQEQLELFLGFCKISVTDVRKHYGDQIVWEAVEEEDQHHNVHGDIVAETTVEDYIEKTEKPYAKVLFK